MTYDFWLRILIFTISSLILCSAEKATASSESIFTPYQEQIQTSLPSGLLMRLPSQVPSLEVLPGNLPQYQIQLNADPVTSSLIINLFSCENKIPNCQVGSLSVESPVSIKAQEALRQHQMGDPITLANNIQGYLIDGSRQNPPNQFSSVMWKQDELIYTVRFIAKNRQDILYMAYSMANATPIPRSSQVEKKAEPILTQTNSQQKIPESIVVKKFEFKGNTAFTQEQLAAETQKFTDGEITFAQLLEVEATVNQLYIKGCKSESSADKPCYINSGAVIPANQNLVEQNGVVQVQIIEGKIEDIRISGTQRLNPDYIRSRLALATKAPVDQKRILKALQLLQLDPLIANISTELSAGTDPYQSLLEVKVKEADTFNINLFTDNGRAPSVGSWRRGINFHQANLFGLGDSLAVSYTNTDGSNTIDASYSIPLNPHNGKLTMAGGVTATNIVEPPFDRIDITGDSFFVELSYRQPLVLTPNEELAVGLTLSRQESKTTLLGIDFPLSAGADENGETKISAIRFVQDWSKRHPQDILALRSQFSLGLDWFNATVNDEPPDSRFFVWRGQAQYVRRLSANDDTLLFLRSDLQLATESLVPLEQFGLGGINSVRGYRQDIFLTDNGFFASAEVRLPVLKVTKINGLLQLVPFVDFGIGWNTEKPDPEQNTLLGVGLGLQWRMQDFLNVRFDWGIPLVELDSQQKTLQENGLYLRVESNLF
ncbi:MULTISPECIES: ShlB/FhaC/HecB family hemolysin secretion/activation protein [Anabaena]|uniref:Surface antigen (D15) n=1 Tax=Anabaena cylindrica (strain ATCC 27899 / PCC 7122) TaxID=272123 RepID=K9ZS77_ANACC|nr:MULTISPECIES: ShlB/FhaC/HecB family hemolysin secretion/activation protein [Anabaena]AFZ61387.1 surface antigen (D15) [Anabaena cylindrica PCC 7122]MCM2405994.1 ShlB/FhaC/HecB family hemolysin secretion/activation protein [Anabaena sp. CCAP 1446/1C]BAY06717.1 surface antigen D15 domain-containing protein [Anabaena cylindrica PCC 7122]